MVNVYLTDDKGKKWDYLPFLSYPLFLLVLIFNHNSVLVGFISAIIAIVVTFACKSYKDKKYPQENSKSEERSPSEPNPKLNRKSNGVRSRQLAIFATLFAIIGGLAIGQSLYNLSLAPSCNDQQPSTNGASSNNSCFSSAKSISDLQDLFFKNNQMILTCSFFVIGIIYYHCGVLFFTTEAAKLVNKNQAALFASSAILFLEAIILYLAASSTNNLLSFSFWIAALMIIDLAWILINIQQKIHMLFQWLQLDSLIFIFLLILLLSFNSDPKTLQLNCYLVLFLFVIRVIADYKMGWNTVWSSKPLEDKDLPDVFD